MDDIRTPRCMKCKTLMNEYECGSVCAIADKNRSMPIYTCGMCGAKNHIYSVTEYRVLRLIDAPKPVAESEKED
jgi:hypothetical protein